MLARKVYGSRSGHECAVGTIIIQSRRWSDKRARLCADQPNACGDQLCGQCAMLCVTLNHIMYRVDVSVTTAHLRSGARLPVSIGFHIFKILLYRVREK